MLQWVKNGLIFGIFSSVLLMLCPNKSYYKHISLVVGLLFVLVMISPIAKWSEKDFQYYTDYMRRFIFSEQMELQTDNNYKKTYSDFMKQQIESHLLALGYKLKVNKIILDDNDTLLTIRVHLDLEGKNLKEVETVLQSMVGQDVNIIYE